MGANRAISSLVATAVVMVATRGSIARMARQRGEPGVDVAGPQRRGDVSRPSARPVGHRQDGAPATANGLSGSSTSAMRIPTPPPTRVSRNRSIPPRLPSGVHEGGDQDAGGRGLDDEQLAAVEQHRGGHRQRDDQDELRGAGADPLDQQVADPDAERDPQDQLEGAPQPLPERGAERDHRGDRARRSAAPGRRS